MAADENRRVPPSAPPNSYGGKDLGVGGVAPTVKIPRRVALVLMLLLAILATAGAFALWIAVHPPTVHSAGIASAAEVDGLSSGSSVKPAPQPSGGDQAGPSGAEATAPPTTVPTALATAKAFTSNARAVVPDANGMCDNAAGFFLQNGMCVPVSGPTGGADNGGGGNQLTPAQIAAAEAQAQAQAAARQAAVQKERDRLATLQAASRVTIDSQASVSVPSPGVTPSVPMLVAQATTPATSAATPSPAPTGTSPAASLHVPGAFTLKAGDQIPVTLIGDLNAEQACDVIPAQVRYDVFDSKTHSVLLIPAGSRLVGTCRAAAGFDTHIDSLWQRIEYPDDRPDTVLGEGDRKGLSGSDAGGGQGITAQVDDHRGRLITTAFIPAIAAALGQLAQPQRAAVSVVQVPSIGSTFAGAAGATLSEASGKILQAQVNRPPTLRVASGFRFIVRVAKDIQLPAFDGGRP